MMTIAGINQHKSIQSVAHPKILFIISILLLLSNITTTAIPIPRNLQQVQTQSSPKPTQIYQGITTINNDIQNNDKLTKIKYYVSFSKYDDGCQFKACYYGYIHNYTIKGEETVFGYPKNVKAIFVFMSNSKDDYVIERHPELEDALADIVDVSCQLFQPNLKDDIQKTNGGAVENFRFASLGDFQKDNPDSVLLRGPTPSGPVLAASIRADLPLKDIEAKQSSLKQDIMVDQNYNMLSRNKLVTLNLPTDKFGQEQTNNSLISKINVRFNNVDKEEIDHSEFKKYAEDLKQFDGKQTFTAQKIQSLRSGINYFKEEMKQTQKPMTKSGIVTTADIVSQLKGNQPLSACSLTNSSLGKTIMSYNKNLAEVTVLGKKFVVGIVVDAILVTTNTVKFRGTVVYTLFGISRTAEVFNHQKQINYNWGDSYTINGWFPAQIYLGLPYPVSFLGITFRFTVYVDIQIGVYGKSDGRLNNCVLAFQLGADVSTGVRVSAIAGIQVTAIQGGVYIDGTIIRIGTNPKLITYYNVTTKTFTRSILWYLYIYAFRFQWGFYYRTWGYWSGWSDKSIIASWPIINGYTQTYLIYRGT